MSISFNANQYEGAFVSHRLQNWEKPMKHKKATWFNDHYVSGRPSSQDGFTQVMSNERGHLLEGVIRSDKNPWGNFVGTWDLPKKIPGNCAKAGNCATARRPDAHDKLHRQRDRAAVVIKGEEKNDKRQQNLAPAGAAVPPACMAETGMLEQDVMTSPAARRSGAEAPICKNTSVAAVAPVSTSPERKSAGGTYYVAKSPAGAPCKSPAAAAAMPGDDDEELNEVELTQACA